jgi:HAE1 family hydrophobic/amphiphilic exporter-1
LASGAGAGAQTRMGTAVFWGMLLCTVVGVFIIPGLFAMMERLGSKKKAQVPPRNSRRRPPAGGH